MAFLHQIRTPCLSFIQTTVSLFLGAAALMSPYWCVGRQKVPKPLCSFTKHTNCIPVPGVSNSSSMQFSWATGDDRFVFPAFHTGLFVSCQENIYKDTWEEKCREFYTLTPGSEKAMMWLSLSMEITYVGLLFISCMLLSVQLGMSATYPSAQRWGQMLNAFAAVFTVLGGLIGMVAHMMFMQVFQTTASIGPEDFKPHSYGYSWAFYIAWLAFTVCMAAGVSTLNDYTKKVLRLGHRYHSSFKLGGVPPPAPYYTPAHPDVSMSSQQTVPLVSHLSPYYHLRSTSDPHRPACCLSLPLPQSDAFPPHPTHTAPASPVLRLALPSSALPEYEESVLPGGWPRGGVQPIVTAAPTLFLLNGRSAACSGKSLY